MKKLLFTFSLIVYIFPSTVLSQDFEFNMNPQHRVASLKMTEEEYYNYTHNDSITPEDLTKEIYTKYKDTFDFVVLILNEEESPSHLNYSGLEETVVNDVSGIGQLEYDISDQYGSAGRLESVVRLAAKDYIIKGPMLHEMFHRWGNYAIRTTNSSHWGYTGGYGEGQVGGFNQNKLIKNVDGNPNKYRVKHFGTSANNGNSVPYNKKELYLMGLIPASELKPFDVLYDISSRSMSIDSTGNLVQEFVADSSVTYDSTKLISELGRRSPSYKNSQKNFNALFVVVTDSALTYNDWQHYNSHVKQFCNPAEDESGIYNFYEATGGRATLNADSLHTYLKDPKKLKVTMPGPTNEYYKGTQQTINWTSSTNGSINIDLYHGMEKVETIANNVPVSDSSYNWQIGYNYKFTKNHLIKISLVSDSTEYDFTNQSFSLKDHYYTISGYVLDSANNPLQNATVSFGDLLRVDQTQETPGVNFYITNSISSQEFRPTGRKLSKTAIYIKKNNSPDSSLYVSIKNPKGYVLSRDTVLADSVSSSGNWHEFSYIPSIPVDSNKVYTINVHSNTNASNGRYLWSGAENNPYKKGISKNSSGNDSADFRFKTWKGDGAMRTTNTDGYYMFRVPENWSGILEASVPDTSFNFEPIEISNIKSNKSEQNFIPGTATSLTKISKRKTHFKIYPNPTDRRLFVQSNGYENENITIRIINSSGRLVYSKSTQNITNQQIALKTSSLNSGIYLLQISTNDGIIRNKKFIKK